MPSKSKDVWSLPSLGAWIETSFGRDWDACARCRSLHWERGLKHHPKRYPYCPIGRSLHWERGLKQYFRGARHCLISRSLHWERGLKRVSKHPVVIGVRRSLHWERGLKQKLSSHKGELETSLPSLGAWIETGLAGLGLQAGVVAPFIGSVD